MIYITGDTHIPIDIKKLNTKNFSVQKNLTRKDYLIICGDFGGIWDGGKQDKYWLDWLNRKNFTILFVDGNHENFDMLNNDFEVVSFLGGKVHKIRSNIYHLMRGEIFVINEKKFFIMGGASSHDKEWRKEGISWWPEELPNAEEYKNALDKLEEHHNTVDYVITHCAATSTQTFLSKEYGADQLTDFLEELRGKLTYKRWCFGHYHQDKIVNDRDMAIYHKILVVEE